MTYHRDFFKQLIFYIILAGVSLSLVLNPLDIAAQKPTKIKLLKANDLKYSKQLGEKVQRLIGNVQLQHDSALLFCDSAYLYELTNSFKGFGNVHIKASDTLNIFSNRLLYDGNTKVAELIEDVRLVENDATLFTNHLWYNRGTEIAYYLEDGKIVDSANTLTSTRGYYYTRKKEAYFKKNVVLYNKEYSMFADTLMYNTETETAWFYGPTTIMSKENLIYCEKGWYNTKQDIARFGDNAYIQTKEQILKGDDLYYDRNRNYGEARNNVSLTDTIQDIVVYGHYGEFRKTEGYSFITDSTVAVLADKEDSLYMHSDTLWILFDSLQKAELMLGYHHTKFWRKELQGMCDSLVYNFADSTIYLFTEPVLWSGINQLTADSIHIAIRNNQIDTLALVGSSFIVSMDDTLSKTTFNQVKGRTMTGYFKDNELVKVIVKGNAESIFFVREENSSLIGINKTTSNDLNIYLSENEVQTISPLKNVEAQMYPDKDLPKEDRKIKGFKWIDNKRPVNKQDIFIW